VWLQAKLKEKRLERSTSCGVCDDDAGLLQGWGSGSPGQRRWIEQQSRGPQLESEYFLSWLLRVSLVRTVSGNYFFFKLKPGQSHLLWSFIDQTQHAPNRRTGLPRAHHPNGQSGGWYLLHVRHASPHTAQHREILEVSKKFCFAVGS
jgi:hypothetical protein